MHVKGIKTKLLRFLLLVQIIVDTKVPIWVGLAQQLATCVLKSVAQRNTCTPQHEGMHAKKGVLKGGTKEHMHTQHEGMHLQQRDTTISTTSLCVSWAYLLVLVYRGALHHNMYADYLLIFCIFLIFLKKLHRHRFCSLRQICSQSFLLACLPYFCHKNIVMQKLFTLLILWRGHSQQFSSFK